MPKAWKGAVLVCGEPGTGKSRWIRDEAAAARARLFRWNVRTDRSLREGREILHQQVRSKERLFVWIEGADDLTQEAQAFLRRILETAAPSVTCVLEAREMWKLSPPVLSRCTVVTMNSERSFRSQNNHHRAAGLGLPLGGAQPLCPSWHDIPACRKAAADPLALLETAVAGDLSADALQAMRAVGAGSSAWIQLANYLLRKESRAAVASPV
jgi:hypothetical protein